MKREIKFRAWMPPQDNRIEGEMIYLPLAGMNYFDFEGSYALSFVVDGYNGFWAHECYDKKKIEYILMQYTGLKDKNGKEIYEGDFISENGSKPYEVIWQFHSVQWIMQSTQPGRYYREMAYDYAQRDYEVIGNIYENPELLK